MRRLVAIALFAASAVPCRGQDLVTMLRHARLRRIAQERLERDGLRLPLRDPEPLVPWAATPRAARELPVARAGIERPPRIPVGRVETISRLERPVFRARFDGVSWAFHQGRTFSALDTTWTADIRARLQARFGNPTQTLAERDSVETLAREEIIQFEYWFVLNDSIPLVVLDVNGPLERGLVTATDARWRDALDGMRRALLDPLFTGGARAPYVDYWYRFDERSWSAAGFDGASFFERRIARPDLRLGRPSPAEYGAVPASR